MAYPRKYDNEQKKALAHKEDRLEIEDMPTCIVGVPEPPIWLSKDANLFWQHVTTMLTLRSQISKESYTSLIALCECFASWKSLRDDILQNGYTHFIDGPYGEVERPRPQVAMFSDADKRLKAWLIEFGLTDASRSKVRIRAVKNTIEHDPLAEFGLN